MATSSRSHARTETDSGLSMATHRSPTPVTGQKAQPEAPVDDCDECTAHVNAVIGPMISKLRSFIKEIRAYREHLAWVQESSRDLLADHIRGQVHFAIQRTIDNVIRAKNRFVEDIMKHGHCCLNHWRIASSPGPDHHSLSPRDQPLSYILANIAACRIQGSRLRRSEDRV